MTNNIINGAIIEYVIPIIIKQRRQGSVPMTARFVKIGYVVPHPRPGRVLNRFHFLRGVLSKIFPRI